MLLKHNNLLNENIAEKPSLCLLLNVNRNCFHETFSITLFTLQARYDVFSAFSTISAIVKHLYEFIYYQVENVERRRCCKVSRFYSLKHFYFLYSLYASVSVFAMCNENIYFHFNKEWNTTCHENLKGNEGDRLVILKCKSIWEIWKVHKSDFI